MAGISVGPEDFDCKMQAYPAVIDVDGQRFLFYSGNGFGAAGFCGAAFTGTGTDFGTLGF